MKGQLIWKEKIEQKRTQKKTEETEKKTVFKFHGEEK